MSSCVWLLRLALAATSKLGASKVAAGAADVEAVAGSGSCAEPPMPVVVADGVRIERAVSETHALGGRTVHMRALHDELQLTYVHNIASAAEIARLVELADARGGFIRSPLPLSSAHQRSPPARRRRSRGRGRAQSRPCQWWWPTVSASSAQ